MSEKEPATFADQVKAKGLFIQTLVSIACIAGHGVGTVKAHTAPVITKIKDMVPEGLAMAHHAYGHSKYDAQVLETLRMAKRRVAKAAKDGVHAAADAALDVVRAAV